MSPELRDRLDRLNGCQLDEYPVTELSVVSAWLDQYEAEQTRLGLDTPPEYPPPLPRSDGRMSGWGTNEDWGGSSDPTGSKGSSSGSSSDCKVEPGLTGAHTPSSIS